jgi:uncharacterized protein (TIGR02217 family)
VTHYDDVIFPLDPGFGSSYGPSTAVDVVFTGGGYRFANARWAAKLRKFSVELSAKRIADAYAVKELFEAMDGPLHSFLMRDWTDWHTASDDDMSSAGGAVTAFDVALKNTVTGLYAGNGSAKTFQLEKRYTAGTKTHYRTIAKPQSGSVRLAVDGVEKTEGSPTDFSVNYATGMVTFQVAPGSVGSPTAVPVTGGCKFYVPVAFVDNDFSTVLRTLKTDGVATIELIEVRGV